MTSMEKVFVQRLADAELSLASRVGYVALLLVALMMTTVIAALLVTEPVLAPHTQIAFAVMIGIGLSWAAFAAWVLTRRRVLLAGHKIVAGRMAVTFTSVFVIGSVAVRYATGNPRAFIAAASGMVMLTAAVIMLVRAHRTFARLNERRNALERELKDAGIRTPGSV
jgi:glucan phosphoethanolaminetransferase (alkaline phosphatase superfamily)